MGRKKTELGMRENGLPWNLYLDRLRYLDKKKEQKVAEKEIPCGLCSFDQRVQTSNYDDNLVVEEFLSTLSEQHRFIIVHRFALGSHNLLTQKQIGCFLHLTRQRICSLEQEILRKLRRLARQQEEEERL